MKTNHQFSMVFFAVMVLAAVATSQALGISYKAVDLNPSGFDSSVVRGISGIQQVGSGGPATGGNSHALLWSGSADSFIDLHQFLPTGLLYSIAMGIDEYGNIVGLAYGGDSSKSHAILWEPVPEPASAMLIGLGCLFAGLRRRQRSNKDWEMLRRAGPPRFCCSASVR